LHVTTSRYDPSSKPHATIYVTDEALRAIDGKNSVHWRPVSGGGESLILTREEELKSKIFVGGVGKSTAREIGGIFERYVLISMLIQRANNN
jgi:hypothetical protein